MTEGPLWASLILWLPLMSMALCGLCAAFRVKSKAPAWITVLFLGTAFGLTLALYFTHAATGGAMRVHLFDWINIQWGMGDGGRFVANFSLYIDSLTMLWMLFVTGLGTLIALYASEYMEADVGKGYARFFAGVSVFLFAMTALVMGDNLVMLYLGWEGVGFASYWLIGYYYTKPSAVAAAKKAFIMNRIGDLGLALAIWLIWLSFGTVEYHELFAKIAAGGFATEAGGWSIQLIPFLLMLGAFGKSAQFPLYVWLPDAMEGPTPVSALIHAATMVTAGVYLLARMVPVMEFHPFALPTVAWIGAGTALLAATIGMAQYDIKRIMAYSTVSQLGFMFAGIGVLTTFGAAYHVFTHAFFKAVLFLTCGAIMHGFAGQLDLRKLSGLRHIPGWKIVSWTMLIGCLCLAGFPLTSGYFSKDVILAEAFTNEYTGIGWVLLFTAGLTAYYTFRVWFRVCAGPVHYEMGEEHHGEEEAHDEHAHSMERSHAEPTKKASQHDDHHDANHNAPHAPRLAINFVLIVITLGALLAALPYFLPEKGHGWLLSMVNASSAAMTHVEHGHGLILGFDPHKAMYFVSAIMALIGIAIAFYFHLLNRKAADVLRAKMLANPMVRWLPTAMENKWYVDEMYHALFRAPLWVLGIALDLVDRYIVDGLIINGTARLPRFFARQFQPMQNGILQSYGVAMIGGAALITLLVLHMPDIISFIESLRGGRG